MGRVGGRGVLCRAALAAPVRLDTADDSVHVACQRVKESFGCVDGGKVKLALLLGAALLACGVTGAALFLHVPHATTYTTVPPGQRDCLNQFPLEGAGYLWTAKDDRSPRRGTYKEVRVSYNWLGHMSGVIVEANGSRHNAVRGTMFGECAIQ